VLLVAAISQQFSSSYYVACRRIT